MSNSNYEIQILVNNKPIKKYYYSGRYYIEARKGTEYSIKIKNNTNQRVLCPCSVDSLNCFDGNVNSNMGYIISPYSSVEIKGFRTSSDVVHPFVFNKKSKSYAAKSEATNYSTKDVGVIGCRIFGEKVQPVSWFITNNMPWVEPDYTTYNPPLYPKKPHWNDDKFYRSVGQSPSATCGNITANYTSSQGNLDMSKCSFTNCSTPIINEDSFSLGTEFSKKEVVSKTVEVPFEIGELITELNVYYASYNDLIAMGVPINQKKEHYIPQAFPGKYCQPPKY